MNLMNKSMCSVFKLFHRRQNNKTSTSSAQEILLRNMELRNAKRFNTALSAAVQMITGSTQSLDDFSKMQAGSLNTYRRTYIVAHLYVTLSHDTRRQSPMMLTMAMMPKPAVQALPHFLEHVESWIYSRCSLGSINGKREDSTAAG